MAESARLIGYIPVWGVGEFDEPHVSNLWNEWTSVDPNKIISPDRIKLAPLPESVGSYVELLNGGWAVRISPDHWRNKRGELLTDVDVLPYYVSTRWEG